MSRYWNNHPEEYDEIIVKELVRQGFVSEEEAENTEASGLVNQYKDRKGFHRLVADAEADYWATKADYYLDRAKEERLFKKHGGEK